MRLVYLYCIVIFVDCVAGETYSLDISPDEHVNEVDERFLSFSIDPALLLTKNEDTSKELLCMVTALSPAYLRLSGPSTSFMSFYNYTVAFSERAVDDAQLTVPGHANRLGQLINPDAEHLSRFLIVSHTQWVQFVHWAQSAGFRLVFGLNNREKTENGLWDPNTALSILTIADHANLTDIYWELGHKCQNQSADEYLTDTETLRVMITTLPLGRRWGVVAGDLTPCLHSSAQFRDYYSLAVEVADALMMNGPPSAHYLSLMPEEDRLNLLQLLSFSSRPLWFTEASGSRGAGGAAGGEAARAADWLRSLGRAARSGFQLHYRQLRYDELYKPTLSFYMALLYKNLVGGRVVQVGDPRDAAAPVFAHCTTLRHKSVPGALTLYGVNPREQAARVALRWTRREAGGDVMRFILAHNDRGNIVVNGREMQNEADILPIVKHVRPYRSLILNLPPKSFGFWVLANTNIKACRNFTHDHTNVTTDVPLERKITKRSIQLENDETDESEIDISEDQPNRYDIKIPALQERIDAINKELKLVQKSFNNNFDAKHRKKRQVHTDEQQMRKINIRNHKRPILRNNLEKIKENQHDLKPKRLLQRLIELHSKRNPYKTSKNEVVKKIPNKRYKNSNVAITETQVDNVHEIRNKITRLKRSPSNNSTAVRFPRYIFRKHRRDDYITENVIEDERLNKIKKINDYGMKYLEYFDQPEDDNSTEFFVDDPIGNVSNEADDTFGSNIITTTVWRLITALTETNTLLERFAELFT